MTDNSARLGEVCDKLFAMKMPGNVPTTYNRGPYRILQAAHRNGNIFQISLLVSRIEPNRRSVLEASAIDKKWPEGYLKGYNVYQLLSGQRKFHPAGGYEDPTQPKNRVPSRFPQASDELLRQLNEALPFAEPKKCYWGRVEDGKAAELLVLTHGEAESDEDNETPGLHHFVVQGVTPRFASLTNSGKRMELVDFWQAVRKGELADLEPLLKSSKKQWCYDPAALVIDGELLTMPQTWRHKPTLQATDLKLVKVR